MTLSEMKQLEVVNLTNGKILGTITDFIINLKEAKIEAIIVPGNSKIKNLFNNKEEYIIYWSDIKKIGEEVILVSYSEELNTGE